MMNFVLKKNNLRSDDFFNRYNEEDDGEHLARDEEA